MAKAKKQKEKSALRLEKTGFNEKHSLPDNDSDNHKAKKKEHRKQRRLKEENHFDFDFKNKAQYFSKK